MATVIKFTELKQEEAKEMVLSGKVFVYPTDTIYGIGCNALDDKAVLRVREAKQREEKPFSVIAPSKAWIYKHFNAKKVFIEKLPGPFTFIMNAKKQAVSSFVAKETVGVRMPDHPLMQFLQAAKVPIVTTSVNITGKKPITKVQRIPRSILAYVDIVIDAGELNNPPSTVIDITGELPRILR